MTQLLYATAFAVAIAATVSASRLKPLAISEMPSYWGGLVLSNTDRLLRPKIELARLEYLRKGLARLLDLPRIREAVGDAPVDILSHGQGVLFLNDLNYRPRPVFQGYQAGTQKLARRNAEYFAGPDAPEFVIAWITPIDQRFPTTEDSETLKTVLWRYEPVLRDGPYHLLRRMSRDPGPLRPRDLRPPLRRTIAWGEWIDADAPPDTWQLLSLTVAPSLLGHLRNVAFRPPLLYFETRFSDGGAMRWRIHRGMIENGFILNPYLLFGDEMRAAYRGVSKRSIVSFRVLTEAGHENFFDADIGIELRTIAPLTGYLK